MDRDFMFSIFNFLSAWKFLFERMLLLKSIVNSKTNKHRSEVLLQLKYIDFSRPLLHPTVNSTAETNVCPQMHMHVSENTVYAFKKQFISILFQSLECARLYIFTDQIK
jgi:hypothetical protein